MSTNMTVATARSGSTLSRIPVRNSWVFLNGFFMTDPRPVVSAWQHYELQPGM